MAITEMCNENDPDAREIRDGSHTYHIATRFVGLVTSVYERNGRDDSDFFAVVWNSYTQSFDHIQYATTRGWTYPNHAEIDATPEVLAEVALHLTYAREQARIAAAKREAATPTKGKTVKIAKAVTRGKHVCEAGVTGVVTWFGEDTYKVARHNRYLTPLQQSLIATIHPPTYNKRCGVKLTDGRTVFVSAENVEVVG